MDNIYSFLLIAVKLIHTRKKELLQIMLNIAMIKPVHKNSPGEKFLTSVDLETDNIFHGKL